MRHSPRRDREAISHHFDLGDEFYALLLGPSLATHVAVLEEAGFEVRDVEKLREHYALTCRAWVDNLERRWDEAVQLSSPGQARVWRLYLAGAALAFEHRRVGVNQVLALKAGSSGAGPQPGWRHGKTPAA